MRRGGGVRSWAGSQDAWGESCREGQGVTRRCPHLATVLLRSPLVERPLPLTQSWAFCGGALGVGRRCRICPHMAASPRDVRWFRETLALALLFSTFVGCSLTLSLLLELESGLLY